MERRTFVVAAAAAASTAVAGCTGGATGGGGGGTDPRETEEPTATGTATPGDGSEFPRITNRSFERTGDADEPGESATVAFETDLVTVSGVIEGSDGCKQASLAAAEYDRAASELRVRVETVDEGGDVCTQQLVYRTYEAAIEFAGGLPQSVVVEHESMGRVRTVTDATR